MSPTKQTASKGHRQEVPEVRTRDCPAAGHGPAQWRSIASRTKSPRVSFQPLTGFGPVHFHSNSYIAFLRNYRGFRNPTNDAPINFAPDREKNRPNRFSGPNALGSISQKPVAIGGCYSELKQITQSSDHTTFQVAHQVHDAILWDARPLKLAATYCKTMD